ncbi:glycoside hydrolase family 43 protein [Streptomyces sp. TLI_171]|uniref:glycoside hydrolase family 43 protein n=1 Tax=Streptomyces sp. TLI_171 TaxID=1938859 RepID=UPI000C176F04|nr:glycoside hydrolase family 43 protein [Streptomyces sp. TLI_171]RKE17115.1 beta-xylosidase [Streptomyces sp. TLI_171]
MTPTNPVVPGFHPDPSVCRVGEDYYLACSSFEYHPGVPILHSRDLIHWRQIGNALADLPLPADTPSSGGVYAPTLRYHEGRFWLITTEVGTGNLLVTAEHPAGPWSAPVRLPDVPGIDPDLAWDEDGSCWCTVAGVAQLRIDPETGKALERPRPLWSGTRQAPEAPHLYRIGDWWYLMIAEGGTERAHSVSIARSRRPDGPYEPCPDNPVLTHAGSHSPIQNTGHADLVQGPDGSWWAVLLGVRPQGGTPGWHPLGRETFLAPVRWVDDWPVIDRVPVELPDVPWPLHPWPAPPGREGFDGPLPPRWLSVRDRPAAHITTGERPGWLTLHARHGHPDGTFTGLRQQQHTVRARARLDCAAGTGGLMVRLDDEHAYAVEAGRGRIRVVARLGGQVHEVAAAELDLAETVLRIDTAPAAPRGPRTGPDALALGHESADGAFTALATLDGRYLTTEVAGGFTGRVIGLYAADGTAHFDWFDLTPLD